MTSSYKISNLSYTYPKKQNEKSFVLGPLSFSIPKGKITFICGRSGSGKSTLLAFMGLLRTEYEGEILIDGLNAETLKSKKKELYEYRLENIGFALQKGRLLPYLTVEENSTFILNYLKNSPEEIKEKSQNLFQKLFKIEIDEDKEKGGEHDSYSRILNSLPEDISGGQYQRAALARALINSPKIILADEPTGNLDVNSGEHAMNLLKNYLEEKPESTIVVVSHDLEYARLYADKIIILKKGDISVEIEKVDSNQWEGSGINISNDDLDSFLNSKIKDNG
ncbi:MAG: ABC transporter ATP-binding protein [Bacteroidota bacterium]